MHTPDPTPEEFAERLAEVQATEAFKKRQPKPKDWLPPVVSAVSEHEEFDE